MNMRQKKSAKEFLAKSGLIPIVVLWVIGALALFASGTVVGLLLSKKTQSLLLVVALFALLAFLIVNTAGIIRWWKSIRDEVNK